MQEIMARLTGQPIDLLSFEEVRQKFKLRGGSSRGLREIPLEAIVGSVGRYTDFTRSFLPRQDSDEHRWAGVKAATLSLSGLPPIEVYQIGQVYFVLDGNHRVSVARELGATHIEAYVTEFKTKVPLEPDDQPDDLIIKAEYADFLERTNLDKLRPEADLQTTVPGRYWELETQIEAHRYLLGQEQGREISHEEAVCSWYDNVYLPVVQIIRERGILRDFPERTVTDLYLWILRHRVELEKKLGWSIDPETAAADLAAKCSETPERIMTRAEEKLRDALIPDSLETGPAPGQWRRERSLTGPDERLFNHILVPVSGEKSGWDALEQAFVVARREGGRLHGLHVIREEAQNKSGSVQAIEAEFNRRCREADIPGKLSIEVGKVARKVCERAQWAHLVIMHLAHPPGSRPLNKLSSGFHTALHRCPRPVLAVPGPASPLKRPLVAYDGSPKANEGLFIATYLAGQWQIPLVVMTVIEKDRDKETLVQAQAYLETRGITATFVATRGEVAEVILNTAAEYQCDLIIMGGYGFQPALEIILGSAVDQVLRESQQPTLICR